MPAARIAVVLEGGEAAVAEFAAAEPMIACPAQEGVGVFWHPSDDPAFCHALTIAACLEVVTGMLGIGRLYHQCMHEAGSLVVQFK